MSEQPPLPPPPPQPAPAPQGRPRFARLKLFLLVVTPMVVLGIIAETVATISIARRPTIRVDSATGQSAFEMRIGKWPWSRRTVIPLNSMGYPDREFPQAGSKGNCTHVVFVGDSQILGEGVDRDSSFVEIVRRLTDARTNAGCVRMFNIGVRGTTIDRQTDRIMQTIDRLEPDIVILGQSQTDLTDLNGPGAYLDPRRRTASVPTEVDSIRVRMKIFNANIVRMLTYQMFGGMIQRGIKRDVLHHWSVLADTTRKQEATLFMDTYSRLFGELLATLEKRRVAFGVMIMPSKFDILAGRYPEESFFVQLAEKHRVPYLRLFPTLDEHRSPYAFLMYDGHLNELGNRLIAAELYKWLFETDPAPFPQLRLPQAAKRSPGA